MKKKLLLLVAALGGLFVAKRAKARGADDAALWTEATSQK